MRLNPVAREQVDSPIGATYALLGQRDGGHQHDGSQHDGSHQHDGGHELLDLGQAAPTYAAAPEVVEHVAAVARRPDGGSYVPLQGLAHLRETFAHELCRDYGGGVEPGDVVITAGCNQAFCLATSALAAAADEIVLPLPFYFNHDMWLRLCGIVPVYLEPGPGVVPDVEEAAAAITPRTRAVVLVTPGNPSGAVVDPATIGAFAALAETHGIALVLDETYRSFRGTDEPPHTLFTDPVWRDTVVSLHSFSKDFAIAGYRVGALVASPRLGREAMKLLDCMAICAPRVGQEAAWAGLRGARDWRRARAREIAGKQALFEDVMAARPGGFELVSCGAYFGWVRHPFDDRPTAAVVRDLALQHGVLVIPGTAFLPDDRGMLRASFANLEPAAIVEFGERLAGAGYPPFM